MKTGSFRVSVIRLLVATSALLLIPLLAMQFTDEMTWTMGDFAAAGALIFGSGMTYILGARAFKTAKQRAVLGISVVLGLALIWAELSVGVFH